MKEKSYRNFSRRAHDHFGAGDVLSSCRMELTFGCDFHCRHCMTDCYNKKPFLGRELKAAAVKKILGKLKASGVLWLCLTGGDPLARPDFFEIYEFAKKAGFIVTIFTNGASIDRRAARRFAENPPFAIEITVNAVTEKHFDGIAGLPGAFKRVMRALDLLRQERIAFRIKTQITTDNMAEVSRIESFVRGIGVPWEASHLLYPRLDGDCAPCSLRVPSGAVAAKKKSALPRPRKKSCTQDVDSGRLFTCSLDSAQEMVVDPYGFGFLCPLWREPRFDLLKVDPVSARRRAMRAVAEARLPRDARCASCDLKENCPWCPGLAYLETKDPRAPIAYFCDVAARLAGEAENV